MRRLFSGSDRVLAELLEKLFDFKRNLAGAGAGSLVAVFYLSKSFGV